MVSFLQSRLYSSPKYYSFTIGSLLYYFCSLTVGFHGYLSVLGFFVFIIITNQIVSGTMVAFSLVPESMMIPLVRDEEDAEDLYTDDFFWLHERGVDLLFIFVFFHLFRKLYLVVLDYEQEFAWKSGVFSFLIIQIVVFFGLVLCCTHLSEITLTIAANALHTFFFFKGKAYWWFFTDRFLNTDTIIRLAYGHYVSAFFLAFLGVIHGVDMHYDWKTEATFDGISAELVWWDEALSNELSKTMDSILIVTLCCYFLYETPEALSYEIFMWGDVGMSTDIRFYGVAPHWYFRPYMAWLIVCPEHRPGLFGLIYFFVVLFYQPNINGVSDLKNYRPLAFLFNLISKSNKPYKNGIFTKRSKYVFKQDRIGIEYSIWYQFTYSVFLLCLAYTTTFLPYGRFYNRVGGNFGMLISYLYIFLYLAVPSFKRSVLFTFVKNYQFAALKQLGIKL